jgi:arylsulfatase A-like enzyme
VIVADHCASAAGKTKLPMKGYQIPIIFYAPDMMKPGVFTKVTSQVDLPPTLLDLLDAKGDDHFFGDSLFEHEAMPARFREQLPGARLQEWNLTVLLPRQKVQAARSSDP